ncbi:hypothetical protein [Variovorax fucosicus]|uniref:hypothetical protein n=1 Tax=Variovorax fucosicus TaxID=3053517 RepID=UPI002576A9B0|nr:hypothetical protein [Variovorax sp. J22G47]MDM0059001.1 hypothetical protein [Variovorax sp. J22G47]
MTSPSFVPEQFKTRPAVAQVDMDLRKWLRSTPIEERIEFIRKLWPLNYRYSLSLVRSSQLPPTQVELLLEEWLRAGQHNAAKGLIDSLEPVLGSTRFWKVVDATETSEGMRNFVNYHRGDRRRDDGITGA